MMPHRAFAALIGALATAALSSPARANDWAVQLPEQPEVLYRGMMDADAAGYGAHGGMMYGPGVIGFAAVLAGHAIFQETQSNNQLKKLQAAADRILLPYRPALAGY